MKAWRKAREVFEDLLLKNFVFKLLAFGATIIIWLWVQSEQVIEERFRVPIAWTLPSGLVLAEPPLGTATVTLEGVQAFLRTVRQPDLELQVDLSKSSEGDVSLDLGERPVKGLPPQVRVVNVSPGNLRVHLDRKARRKVEVRAMVSGEVADGFRLMGVTVTPARVEVEGPASAVRGLDSVATSEVDIATLRDDTEFTNVPLDLNRNQLTVLGENRFTVKVNVAVIRKSRRFEAVPVAVRPAGRYDAEPPSVTLDVEGPATEIDALTATDLGLVVHVPDDFQARQGTAREDPDAGLRYEVVQPGGLEVRVTPDKITVEAR